MAVVAYEQLTVGAAAVGLAAATTGIGGMRPMAANCTVETGAIRYCADGQTPTATLGVLVNPGGDFRLASRFEVKNFKAIRMTVDAKVNANLEL